MNLSRSQVVNSFPDDLVSAFDHGVLDEIS